MSSRRDSDFHRMEQLLQEAQRLREEAVQRLEEEHRARQEADQRVEEEHRARQEADRALQNELQLNQNTTLEEFLQACHEYYHKPLRIETNKSWTTQGTTDPAGKYYPKMMTPWEGFPQNQSKEFQRVCSIFHPSQQAAMRLFSSISYIKQHGKDYCNVHIANESSLRIYEKLAVEVQVIKIINGLREIEQGRKQFQLGQEIFFENDGNSLSDVAEEVQERLQIHPPRTPSREATSSNPSNQDSRFNPNTGRTRADQYCIYRGEGSIRELLFIVEYKPPHKLSIGNLIGFRRMNVKKEVIDRTDIPPPIPTNETEVEAEAVAARLQYNADKVAMAVATQTFHYMIENGVEYSYIATGEAFIFLHIEIDDPTTLYYHVTVPSEEINDDEPGFPCWQTAIAQVVTLCLMAFRSKRRSHAWRNSAKAKLKTYPVNSLEAVLAQTPASERKLAAGRNCARKSPLYKGGRKVPVTSDYNLRSKCNPKNLPENRDEEEDDPDASGSPTRPSGSNARKNRGKSGGQQKDGGGMSSEQASGNQGVQRQYCTQKCLLGIVRRSRLDNDCPNASLHPRVCEKHAIDRSKFLNLVQKQLAKDLDHHCEPLGLQGARGAIFKITLASHGYVFVGKGTVQAFVPDLLHEGKIYQRLAKLQGTAVPVYLGNIDLYQWYYLDLGVRILHMLLMSWGGDPADEDEGMKNTSELQKRIIQTVTEVRRAGIDQMDVRPPNLLWNQELQRVMLIDFERAEMIKIGPKNNGVHKEGAMQKLSLNKRRKLQGTPLRGIVSPKLLPQQTMRRGER